METLVVVVQYRNQSYNRNRSQISDQPRGINCRTFESGGPGNLSSPPPVLPSFASPPGPPERSSPIPITPEPTPKEGDDLSCSELWAGPAYSNSPPPSSLPIPKFSLRQKRTVSLDLPSPPSPGIALQPLAKSAPPSPTREPRSLAGGGFFLSPDFATQNLRRILNLDID